jgi:hypothetical protein
LFSPAVPSTCPEQRFTAVAGGQPRSAQKAAEHATGPMTGSVTVLPKLAVVADAEPRAYMGWVKA